MLTGMALHLSVNLNKVALLRNSRGGTRPSLAVAAKTCIDAGVQGLTLHWREDNRHTKADDVRLVAGLCKEFGVEFNLEGDQRKELIDVALEVRPTQFTLVPVTPGEVTSDHGWDLPRQSDLVTQTLAPVKEQGIRTAIFVDPNSAMMEAAQKTGVDRVEIYTEPYAHAFGTEHEQQELERFRDCAREATSLGMGVNAGHDLNLENLPLVAREIPEVLEVSIGHALLTDALYLGMEEALKRYLQAVQGTHVEAPTVC